ncbi:MAG: TIGR02099 family protein [Legionellaceae bacterium]|nr:TIGR02099 family protein [Legionellaceae bacterium]
MQIKTLTVTKIFKRAWLLLAFTTIFFAAVFSLFRELTPWVSQYRHGIEQRLSALFGEEVHIGAMETGWYWFEPVIKLKAVQLRHGQQKLIDIGQLLVGIDLPLSLWHWQIQPGILSLENLNVRLQQTDNGWQIDGLSRQDSNFQLNQPETIEWLMPWLLKQQQIRLRHAQLRLHFLDGTLMPFADANLHIQNHDGSYHLSADAKMAQTVPTQMKVQGKLAIKNGQYQQSSGQLYWQVSHFLPGQWQALLPSSDYRVRSGQGSAEFWMTVEAGAIKDGRATFKLDNLAFEHHQYPQQSFIQSLQTTAYWENSNEQLQLTLDDLALRFNGINWPNNQLRYVYDKAQQAMQLHVRYVDLSSLKYLQAFHTDKTLLDAIPGLDLHGMLHHLDLRWSAHRLHHVFARFNQAGWSSWNGWPALEGLSGVLQLDPQQGRLRLDSENVTLVSPDWPETRFDFVNADMQWQYFATGWDIQLRDVNLRHPHLELNTQGTIRQWNAQGNPLLDLHTHLLARDVEYWKPWLPEKGLKPKLYQWIMQEIKHIPKLVGEMVVQGKWQDFPYEQHDGRFRIETLVEDAQVSPLEGWPAVDALSANVGVDGRKMTITAYHGRMGEVLLRSLNAQIDKLGTDRESLLLHARIKDAADSIRQYIVRTPLQQRLPFLSNSQMEGNVDLDLQIDAPLYPEPEGIVIMGDAKFSDNNVRISFDGVSLPFAGVNGNIQFDQHGILDSQLDMTLWHIPMALHMRTLLTPHKALQIEANIPLVIAQLKQHWPSVWWQLLSGNTDVVAKMHISDDPQETHRLQLQTSLKGLAIELPPPFHKSAAERTRLTSKIEFNGSQGIGLQTQWEQRIGSHLWLNWKDGSLEVEKGEIRLGAAKASTQVQQGLQLLGRLAVFDDRQWQPVWNLVNGFGSQGNWLNRLDFIDLMVEKGHWFGQRLQNSIIQSRKVDDIWKMQLKQKDMKADVQWDLKSNAVKMHFNQLQIPQSREQRSSTAWVELLPPQFPSLELRVDHLLSAHNDWGRLSLVGKNENKNWRLERLLLENPSYALKAHGIWQTRTSGTESTLDIEGSVTNLSTLFQRLNYPQLIEAKTGYVHVKAQWPGPIFDPVLNRVSGEGYLAFQDGQISELSKETEEKIGLGKMLSIFSLQTIPRRLRLDFSDLSNRGYTFDKIESYFNVHDAVLTTQKSTVNGPVAHATLKGKVNLLTKQCDLKLQVTPHITASLPVVATIAGGPIAGIATWIVNKIVTREMEKVRAYSYVITGSWSQPVIEQGHITRQAKKTAR